MTASKDLLNSSDKQHLMLLYDKEYERSSAEIECINRALAAGRYCVYATVDANDKQFESNLASAIIDFNKHMEEDLRIVNFKPFYDSAASGDLTPFRQLKAQVEATLRDRVASGKNPKALLVADAACNLARNKQFDECVSLESWWQDTYNEWMVNKLDITIICAHPSSVLKEESHVTEQNRISRVHSLTLDLNYFIGRPSADNRASEAQKIRILVAEPNEDIRIVYSRYLQSLPIEVITVTSGQECLEKALMSGKDEGYDMIIIDTHMKDVNGLQLARKILEEKPLQGIAFTTTWNLDTIRSDLEAYSLGVDKYPVLQKPFVFSKLLEIIKPAKFKINN